MNKLKFWYVDSFTHQPFGGNPAAVFILKKPIKDELMQQIAGELNLSETAFILLRQSKKPILRWFTPLCEVDLCGHATLAAAQIYFTEVNPNTNEIIFDTKLVGPLRVTKRQASLTMSFPIRIGVEIPIESIPNFVLNSLSDSKPFYARKSRDLMLVYEDENTVINMNPNFFALRDYHHSIIVTARASNEKYDFISRCFCPFEGISEDPVTGSAHCTLAPYWSEKLKKNEMTAFQASKRGGILSLKVNKESLDITGEAVTLIEAVLSV